MEEVAELQRTINPHEILFVADAMTGQEAVNVAKDFNDRLELTGVVLTKMDGDARGGAALSVRYVLEKPVKRVGMGENMDRLERFYPDRIAGRILGMGDVLSLIEDAQRNYDMDKAAEFQKKIAKDEFTLEDFLDHMQQIKKMGSITDMLGKIPGMGQQMKKMKMPDDPEKELKRIEAIIQSMTKAERRNHTILNASRRKRIAAGSGTSVREVNQLLKQFVEMKKMMKQIRKGGLGNLLSKL
jgi:signal recognition particle subunit SRP54